ncbi:MAG TPA: mercury(II) reductase [Nitrosomonas nitrosa]|nr:mercury(II) reductase [Nitrosomonas sp.]HNP51288.1 mercury(II) reductase [Nitrosomonas nitrosa]
MSDCCENKNTSPDILVIGAGSAGFSAAITAAETGAQVVIAGTGTIGGTCVNVGCVPSKTLIRATEGLHKANSADRFAGITGSAELVDWRALVAQKQALVDDLRRAKYEDLLPEYPAISYVEEQARFTGNGTEVLVGETHYTPRKVIIATGSVSALPPINGIQSIAVLDSTSALELDRLPKSLLIIGGGVIGVELGNMFSRAGVSVTICCRSRLLPETEPEISAALAESLRGEGVRVCEGVGYQKIEQEARGIMLTCETAQGEMIIEAEQVLAAAGRKPNTRTLALENVGIEVTSKGGIVVNEFMQTTQSDVYAIGDVTGADMFVYMAAYGGKLAARNALNGNAYVYDNTTMPAVVFTDPQVANVGLTEARAQARGLDVKTSVITLDNVPRFIASRETAGLIKLVADAQSDALLGAAIFAPEAGDIIQTVVMALKGNLTTRELGDTIFPYLTAVEGLKLAAQSFDKDVKKLSCCAG